MTKREYLEKLARGLRPLPKEERRRQLDYYEEMLSDRMDEGLDEADAVAAMDPPETVIDRVLREYVASGRPLRRHHVGLWIGLGVVLMFVLLTAAVLLVNYADRQSGSTWQFPIFQQAAGDSASTSASASGDTLYPCMAREAAISAISGGKAVCATLTPMPTTSHSAPPSGRREDSVRMPHSFFPSSTTSLHHLMPHTAPQTCWMARHTATAASGVTVSSCPAGQPRHRTDRYSPPSGDRNERPRRPFPAV